MAILTEYSLPKGNNGMILFGERNDDSTVKLPIMPFSFLYNRISVNQIQASGNTWIGFGSGTEHLAVNRRDASYNKLFYANEEEYGIRVFRIRFEGNSIYNSWNSNNLVWEFTVFEDGVFRLVIVASPSTSSDKFINPEGTNPTLKFTAGKSFIFKSKTELGTDYEILEGSYIPGDNKYLMLDDEGVKSYKEENQLGWIKVSDPPLTRELFLEFGVDTVPHDLSGLLNECKICFFTDMRTILDEKEAYQLNVCEVVTSYPQVLTQELDFLLPQGKQIKEIVISTSVKNGMIKVALSPNNGETYYTFNLNTQLFEEIDIKDTNYFLESGIETNKFNLVDYAALSQLMSRSIRFAYIFNKPTIESTCKLKGVKILYEETV